MRYLKQFNNFILSEGLMSKMTPKSDDDVKKSLLKLDIESRLTKIHSLGLDSSYLPPREDIEDFLKDLSTEEILDKNKTLGLDSSFLPPREEIEEYLPDKISDRLSKIKTYNLDSTFLPPREEIISYISKYTISRWIYNVRNYGLDKSYLPSNEHIEEVMKEHYEHDDELKTRANVLLQYLKDNDNADDDLTIYWLEPDDDYYGMSQFINLLGGSDETYAVGTDDEADKAFYEYEESLIDEMGFEGFRPGFIESHIEGERFAEYFMQGEDDYYREDWRSYDIEGEMISSAKDQIEEKEKDISRLEKEREIIDSSDEGADELDEQIDELETEIEDIKEDEDNWEVDEDSLESYINDQKEEISNDPVNYLKDRFGYSGQELNDQLKDFIDVDSVIEAIKEADGRGMISGYDNEENEIKYDDEWFYIYRIN